MPLVLAPSYDDHTRAQIEEHLASVRARRMVAAMEFHAGRTAKLTHESDKLQAKVAKQYERLGKALDKLEAAEQAVMELLDKVEQTKQEYGLVIDMIEIHDVPSQTEE